MTEKTIVNYEELQEVVKKFNNEGEVIAQHLAKLREKVHHLQSEWIGSGSDAFFDEMEMEILPAVQRLSEALLFSGKTLADISKLYSSAEEESKNIFKEDPQNVDLGSTDFGAGQFGNLGGASGTPPTGGAVSEPDLGTTDFGAGQFGGADGAGGAGAGGEGGAQAPVNPSPEGQSAGLDSGGDGSGGAAVGSAEGGGGGGAGGGASGSEGGGGASGNLDSMGSGLKDFGQGGSSSGGSGGGAASGASAGAAMPDHVYQTAAGSSSPAPGGAQTAPAGGTGSGETSTVNTNSGTTAAGIAGIVGGAGAAAGGAAKIIKGKKEE